MKNDISIRAAVYLRAAELIETVGHCKHHLAVHADGTAGSPDEVNCTAFCYRGALLRAHKDITGNSITYKFDQWYPLVGPETLVDWNNHEDTIPAMVAAKLREQAFGD